MSAPLSFNIVYLKALILGIASKKSRLPHMIPQKISKLFDG